MAKSIDLDAWRSALADQQTAQDAHRRFEQHRFNLGEHERRAAAESMRIQAAEVADRLKPLRAAANDRKRVLEERLSSLVRERGLLEQRAASGQGSAKRINRANRTLQSRISDCAIQLNVLAKLMAAETPEDIDALADEEIASLQTPVDVPTWTGTPATALPRVMGAAGIVAALATLGPWYSAPGSPWLAPLWLGVVGESTPIAGAILGYAGIVLPVLLAIVAFTTLRNRRWLTIASAFAVVFVWIGLGYVRLTADVPWWSVAELFGAMGLGAWLYGLAAMAGLIAASYYAQGEGNTTQRSLRTAAWLVALFAVPGLAAAGLIALRPPPPVVAIAVTAVEDEFDVLALTLTNNGAEPIDVSLPWSDETHYGIRVELRMPGEDAFRVVEETDDCWRAPGDEERTLNRLAISPDIAESAWFDVGCMRALGYEPERLRFALTDAQGKTVKAYQAILPK